MDREDARPRSLRALDFFKFREATTILLQTCLTNQERFVSARVNIMLVGEILPQYGDT